MESTTEPFGPVATLSPARSGDPPHRKIRPVKEPQRLVGDAAEAHEVTRVHRVVEHVFDIRGGKRHRVAGARGQEFHVFETAGGDLDLDPEAQILERGGIPFPQLVIGAPLGAGQKRDRIRRRRSEDHQRHDEHNREKGECRGSRQLPDAVFLGD